VIGYLEGTVARIDSMGCLLEVSGVGYRIACSNTTRTALPRPGGRVRLWTHLHVREDALALFGFSGESELAMFESLVSVSGVGPKVALALCSSFSPDAFRRVLATDDVASIATVPGIGKKTAQRVLLELKDRLALPDLEVVGDRPDALRAARSALENLGYSATEVRAALGEVETAGDESVEDVIRSALRVLAS
jgi:holliday junction DNA helicase RuvA